MPRRTQPRRLVNRSTIRKAVPTIGGKLSSPRRPLNFNARNVRPLPAVLAQQIVFICACYDQFPMVLCSLLAQSYANWRLVLTHNGPMSPQLRAVCQALADDRVQLIETAEDVGGWGHVYRAQRVAELTAGDYVIHTNADNYYVPGFCQLMLAAVQSKPQAAGAYCDFTHNHVHWDQFHAVLRYGGIDTGAFMVRYAVAKQAGWKSLEMNSDWVMIANSVDVAGGVDKFVHVPHLLFVHN